MIASAILRRVKEMLSVARNDEQQTERLIMSLIERDPAFLRQLVDPFLKGIVVHAISMARNDHLAARRPPPVQGQSSGTGMDGLIEQLTQNFGKTEIPQPAYSPRQAAAINAITLAQAKRRKKIDD